jgi:hypothetical protein
MSLDIQWGFVSSEPPDDREPDEPERGRGFSTPIGDAVTEWLMLLGTAGGFGLSVMGIVELLRMAAAFRALH